MHKPTKNYSYYCFRPLLLSNSVSNKILQVLVYFFREAIYLFTSNTVKLILLLGYCRFLHYISPCYYNSQGELVGFPLSRIYEYLPASNTKEYGNRCFYYTHRIENLPLATAFNENSEYFRDFISIRSIQYETTTTTKATTTVQKCSN